MLKIFKALCGFGQFANAPEVKDQPVAKSTLYDKAEYHDDSVSDEGLNWRQSFVHTGLFLGWLIDHDLLDIGFWQDEQGKAEIIAFKERRRTGPCIYEFYDGALHSDMLNDEGNAFAQYYFDFDSGRYLKDYEELLAADLPSMFHVKDTWENYDRLKARIDQRYEDWKK